MEAHLEETMKVIMLADLHFKTDNPICRTDNYFETALRKFNWVKEQAGEDGIILIAGDIFDTGKPQSYLKMYHSMNTPFSKNVKTIAGNHDISYKSMSYVNETAYGALSAITGMHIDKPFILNDEYEVHGFNFGEEIEHRKPVFGRKMIAMTHQFVYTQKLPFDIGIYALDLLTNYPEYDIILSGDNHQHFIYNYDGRTLVNPGSLLRMDADQIDFKPQMVVLEDGKISTVPIPIEENAVSRKHLDLRESASLARDNMLAYLELAKSSDKETYDFLSLLQERILNIDDKKTKEILTDVYVELKDAK